LTNSLFDLTRFPSSIEPAGRQRELLKPYLRHRHPDLVTD
jgi:hypothetical protein